MDRAETVLQELRQRGYRMTAGRQAIVGILAKAEQPQSIQEIYDAILRQKKTINLTTVYRELDTLVQEGLCRSMQFGDRHARFEIAPTDHRHHLVCTECRTIEDVVMDHDLDHVEKTLKKQTKFKVLNHNLEFYGLCEKCQ
jgi:Fe2+ or Zn2+ uptake regulation protein